MSVRIGVNITANNSDFLRGVASTKAGIRSLKNEQKSFSVQQRIQQRETRDLNRALFEQSRALKGLTGDYVSVRRAFLTAGVRGAITGFASLTSAINSTAASVGLLGASITNLGAAGLVGGGAGILGLLQGFTVAHLALNGLGAAITKTGQQQVLAMNKLTKPAQQFVKEIRGMEDAYKEIKLLAQEGLFPGLVQSAKNIKSLLPGVKQAVYDTAQTLGYLAERASEMAERRGPLLDKFFQRNIVTMRRFGEATENFAAAFLDSFVAAGPLIGKITQDIAKFSDHTKKKFSEWRKDGSLGKVFDELRVSWENWTGTFGSAGKMVFAWWEAVQPVVHKVEDAIEGALGKAAKWTQSHKNGIADYFEKSLEPMGAFLKLIGRLAETFVKFSDVGNDDLVRFFDGLRIKVIPLLEDIFVYFDAKLFPRILDVGSALVDFFTDALPSIKTMLGLLGPVVDIFIKMLDLGGDFIKFSQGLGSVAGVVATLLVGSTILSSWRIFRQEISLTMLAMRRFTGLSTAPAPYRKMAQTASGFLPYQLGKAVVTAPIHGRQRAFQYFNEREERRTAGFAQFASGRGIGPLDSEGRPRYISNITTRMEQERFGLPANLAHQPGKGELNYLRFPANQYLYQGVSRVRPRSRRTGYYTGVEPRFGRAAPQVRNPLLGQRSTRDDVPLRTQHRYGYPARVQAQPPNVREPYTGPQPGFTVGSTGQRYTVVPGRTGADSVFRSGPGGYARIKDAEKRSFRNMRTPSSGLIGGEADKMYQDYVARNTEAGFKKGMKNATKGGGGGLKGQSGSAKIGAFGAMGGPLGIGLMLLPFLPDILDALKDKKPKAVQKLDNITGAVTAVNSGLRGGITNPRQVGASTGKNIDATRLAKFSGPLEDAIKDKNINALHKLAGGLDSVAGASQNVAEKSRIKDLAKDVHALAAQTEQKGLDNLAGDFENFAQRGDQSIGKVRDGLAVLQNEIGNKTQRKGRVFRDAMAQSFGQAAQQIKLAMDAGTISVKNGTKEMLRLLTEQFKTLGFSKEQAKNLAQTGDISGKGSVGHHGSGQGAAVGGFWLGNKGERGRDTIPMSVGGQNIVAGRGEYVGIFNATQQKAFDNMAARTGHGSMEGFFRGNSRPHYMAGGGIVKLGKQLERQGYDVGENPAFGGVHPVHVKNSLHYSGNALDINADSMKGGEKQNLDRLSARLQKQGWHVLWQVPGHFDHLHVDTANGQGGLGGLKAPKLKAPKIPGDPSLLSGLVAGSLERYREGSQMLLDSAFSGFSGDTGTYKTGKGILGRGAIAGLMRAHGFPESEIATGVAVALAESGGDPNISNSIGATGLWQILLSAHPSVSGTQARDPNFATGYAHKLWQQSGWQPWEAYTGHDGRGSDGPYRKFLIDNHGGFKAAAGLAYSSAKPPKRNHGTPNVDPKDATGNQTKPPKSTPKVGKPHSKKPALGQGVDGRNKPAHPRKKGTVRKKIRKLIDKPFSDTDLNLDNLVDPATGESLDVTKAFYPLQAALRVGKYIDKAGIRLDDMASAQGRTVEEPTVDLYDSDQFKDLTNYYKAIGKNPTEEIGKYGNGLEVINSLGTTRQGKFIRGIAQAVQEIDQQLFIHTQEKIKPYGLPGGVRGAFKYQKSWASSINTKRAIKQRKARLRAIRRQFAANVRVRRAYEKKVRAGKRTKYSYSQAIDHNRDIIDKWRRYKRDFDGPMPEGEKRQADHEIDRLTDLNKTLRRTKPKNVKLAGEDYANYTGRGRENKLLVGDKDATTWTAGNNDYLKGGAQGMNQFVLEKWQEVATYKKDFLDTVGTNLRAENNTIADLLSTRKGWSETSIDPRAIDTDSISADQQHKDDLIKSKKLDDLTAALLGATQFGSLKGFAQLLGQRYVGAYAHGGLVGETGVALVHKGERISPDPNGPFRRGMNAVDSGGSPVYIELVLRDKAGSLVELVDSRIRTVAPNASSRSAGQKSRLIRVTPGG